MSVSYSGATKQYAQNWSQAFVGRRSHTSRTATSTKTTGAPAKKRMPKKAGTKAKRKS